MLYQSACHFGPNKADEALSWYQIFRKKGNCKGGLYGHKTEADSWR